MSEICFRVSAKSWQRSSRATSADPTVGTVAKNHTAISTKQSVEDLGDKPVKWDARSSFLGIIVTGDRTSVISGSATGNQSWIYSGIAKTYL